VDELGPWILAGLLLAGFLEPILSPEFFAKVAQHWQVPLFALLGTPLYICASGATPLAAILLAKGVGPGAVIAFLISGPATNLTTFGAIRSIHPARSAWTLVLAIPIAAIFAGWGVDLYFGGENFQTDEILGEDHHHGLWRWLCAGGFALMLLSSFLRQGPRLFLQQLGIAEEEHDHDHCC
jgi:hypothetical protein